MNTPTSPRSPLLGSVAAHGPMVLALLVVLFITFSVFGDGAMSIDSFTIFTQARAFEFGDHQPPIFGFIWHFVDQLIPGPRGMMALLVTTFYAALALIFEVAGGPRRMLRVLAFAVVALFPPVFGIIGVDWIDIAMAAAFLAACAVALAGLRLESRAARVAATVASCCLVFLGMLQRHNGLPAAIGLLPLALLPLFGIPRSLKDYLRIGASCAVLTGAMLLGSKLVNGALAKGRANLWQVIAAYDLSGISVRVGENLLPPDLYPDVSYQDLLTLYTPRSYTPLFLGQQIHSPAQPTPTGHPIRFVGEEASLNRLKDAWLTAIIHHPLSYLKHRTRVFFELTNVASRSIWTPVYDGVAPNQFGIPSTPSDVNGGYLKRLNGIALSTNLFRPFLYLALCIVLVPATMVLRPKWRWAIYALSSSAVLHAAGLFVGAASGDFRYSHWIIVTALISTALLVLGSLEQLAQAPVGSVRPTDIFTSAWKHRALILRLTKREIEARYRGTLLGVFWPFLTPLIMLAVYTFVFSFVFASRWGTVGNHYQFALLLFSGLLLATVFTESLVRAPTLMLENVSYIKKVVFPLEILPWVAVLSALFNAGVGFIAMALFYPLVFGLPPATALLFPLLLLPLTLSALGIVFLFSSMGVFIRDLKQVVGVLTTIVMFLSPIFYPISMVPRALRPILFLNPLTIILEQSKEVLFWGHLPSWSSLLFCLLISATLATGGYWWFARTRKGFADVV